MRPRESRLAAPEPLSAGDEIRNLRDEMQVLQEAVDELREQLEYALAMRHRSKMHGCRHERSRAFRWIRLPPIGRRVNSINPYGTPQVTPNSAEASPESEPYCCPQPRLTWHGDPDAPGIACENCGYMVAEEGNISCWRDAPDELPAASPADDERPVAAHPLVRRYRRNACGLISRRLGPSLFVHGV